MRTANFAPVQVARKKWRLDVPASLSESGKRRRLYFKTFTEAEAEAKDLRKLQRDRGRSLNELSSNQSADAAAAYRLLKGQNVRLVDLAAEYMEKVQCNKTFKEVAQEWLDAKPRSERYVRFIKQIINSIMEPVGEERIGIISHGQIEKCISGYAPSMKVGISRTLNAIWNYAIQRGYVKENPVIRVKKPHKPKLTERPVISTADLEKLLNKCLNTKADSEAKKDNYKSQRTPDSCLIAPLAVLFFAGVRTFEMLRMDWQSIDLNEEMIDLPANITKRGRRRSIPIEPALKSWLLKHIEVNGIQQGSVCPWDLKSFYKHRDSVCKEAGVKWEQNIPRHSYASYWLAKHGDLNKLALHMGHVGGLEVLHQHYYRCVRQADAETYWEILNPDDKAKLEKGRGAKQKTKAAASG